VGSACKIFCSAQVNVPEGVDKQIVHCLYIVGEETHGFYLADLIVALNRTPGKLGIEPLDRARKEAREPNSLSVFLLTAYAMFRRPRGPASLAHL
jgi:hypothetical protein